MKFVLLALVSFFALPLSAQTPKPSDPITIKSSPTEDALIQAAKDYGIESKAYNDAYQQARSAADAGQKDLQKQFQDAQKSLMDKLKADKHYAPLLDNLNTIQKQIQEASSVAGQEFQKKAGPIQNKMATDNALIQGLIPIVRKENGLPDTATFDVGKGVWMESKAGK